MTLMNALRAASQQNKAPKENQNSNPNTANNGVTTLSTSPAVPKPEVERESVTAVDRVRYLIKSGFFVN